MYNLMDLYSDGIYDIWIVGQSWDNMGYNTAMDSHCQWKMTPSHGCWFINH